MWVSTTAKGLFVCRDINIRHYTAANSFIFDDAVHSFALEDNAMYLGYDKGVIQMYRKDLERSKYYYTPKKDEVQQITVSQGAVYWSANNFGSLHNNELSLIDALGNTKFFQVIKPNLILYKTPDRLGILEFTCEKRSGHYWWQNLPGSSHTLDAPVNTCESINNHVIEKQLVRSSFYSNNRIYVGFNNELVVHDEQGKRVIKYKNKSVFANSFAKSGNTIWIGTNNGLLALNENDITDAKMIKEKDGLIENKIIRVSAIDDRIYAITHRGITCLNARTSDVLYQLDQTDGFHFDQIKDIQKHDSLLYIVSKTGLYTIPYKHIPNHKLVPEVTVEKVFSKHLSYSIDEPIELDYDFDQINLDVNVVDLKSGQHTGLYFKIEGRDDMFRKVPLNGLIEISDLLEGDYTILIYAENSDGLASKKIRIKLSVAPPFVRTIWFYLALVVTVATIVGVIFGIRMRVNRRRLEFEKKVIGSELRSIQSQMNPHFIFNALNSIQDLILKKDIRASNKYLGRFSRLMREVLQNSQKDKIHLQNEIDVLQNYLELEALRIGDSFRYQIHLNVDPKDAEEIYIPVMILQPYVENAIKHGLLHKKGDKRVNISFWLEKNYLICEISDNGIGREQAMKIKKRQDTSIKSFSTEANLKRVNLYNETQKRKILIEIKDKHNGQSGTTVRVQFPL